MLSIAYAAKMISAFVYHINIRKARPKNVHFGKKSIIPDCYSSSNYNQTDVTPFELYKIISVTKKKHFKIFRDIN